MSDPGLRDALEAQIKTWEGYTSDNPDVATGFELAAGKLRELLAVHPAEPAAVEDASRPDQADVDTVRRLLDLMAGFESNDQRARYLLSSNWLRDRGSAAAVRLGGEPAQRVSAK